MQKNRSESSALEGRAGRDASQDRVYMGMLLSFYGELLAPRQRECCELCYNEDLSLSEIAETCGISRQGAWDNIRRGSEALEEIEQKTGLLGRHAEITNRLRRVEELLARLELHCTDNTEAGRMAHAALDDIRVLLRTED